MASSGGPQGLLGLLRFLADFASVEHASAGALIATAVFVMALVAFCALVIWHTYSRR